jgi:hypothetical protein
VRDPIKRAASIKRYLAKRYREDPEFRLKRINASRVRQGYEPLDSLDEAKTTMKDEPVSTKS